MPCGDPLPVQGYVYDRVFDVAAQGYWHAKRPAEEERFSEIMVLVSDGAQAEAAAGGIQFVDDIPTAFDWVHPWIGGYSAGLATALLVVLAFGWAS